MIYLKATNEAAFTAALITAGWAWDTEYNVETDADGNETVTDHIVREAGIDAYTISHSLDVIGAVHVPTGDDVTFAATDDMPEHTYPEMEAVDGWHANLLLHGEELPAALADMVIEAPANPVRRFA